MPVVQVSVWEGMSPENKKKTVEGITKVFEDMGSQRKRSPSSFMKRQNLIGQQAGNFTQKDTQTAKQNSARMDRVQEKKFKLSATVSSANPSAVKPVLERIVSSNGSIRPSSDGFEVNAEFKGESARDLNRMLLNELRKAEKKTRLRSEWTSEDNVEKFFDYALKQTKKPK